MLVSVFHSKSYCPGTHKEMEKCDIHASFLSKAYTCTRLTETSGPKPSFSASTLFYTDTAFFFFFFFVGKKKKNEKQTQHAEEQPTLTV